MESGQLRAALKDRHKIRRPELLEDSRPTSRLKYGEPAQLKLGRKIFLSHSSKDKDFVRFLNKELCRHYNNDDKITFFDEESLPKAEAISMDNILEEARESELGVLVLSEDFFVNTRNPMRELQALVTSRVRLLPLFFTLSVDEVKDPNRRARWVEKWRKWPEVDEGVINVWTGALKLVITHSGLEYCKIATNWCNYIDKIVEEVIHILPPAIPFSEEGVVGMRRMCQIVNEMYKECAFKNPSNTNTDGCGHTLDVVGIYGFAGLGKTTLSIGLCDFYRSEFKGKVCHVALGSKPFDEASPQTRSYNEHNMRHILSKLTDYNYRGGSPQGSELKNTLLTKKWTDPVFLAIDNILSDEELLGEAHFYFSLKFPKGSKIFITSRSRDILEKLTSWYGTSFSVVIRHIPKLEFKEARDILVHEIPSQMCKFGSTINVEDEVKACVKICMIYEERSQHYHPLMLKSLATFLILDGMPNMERNLADIRSKGISYKNNDPWNTIFKVLDKTYEILSEPAKTMFLDLALFYTIARCDPYKTGAWIHSVYSHFDSKQYLSELRNSTFIHEALDTMWSFIQIHDVLVEFAKYKVSPASLNPHYNWVVESDTPWQNGRVLKAARSVTIARCHFDNSTPQLDLRNVEGVELLHLIDNAGLQEVLWSPTTRANLRSLIVMVPPGFSLCMVDHSSTTSTSPAPSPKYCEVRGNLVFRRRERRTWLSSVLPSLQSFLRLLQLQITAAPLGLDLALGGLQNLENLTLSQLPVQSFVNVKGCAKLTTLELDHMPSMTSIQGLDELANLQSLDIVYCDKLPALSIFPADNCSVHITHCDSLKRITLCTQQLNRPAADCTTTGSDDAELVLTDCPTLTNIEGISEYKGSLFYSVGDQGCCIGCEDRKFILPKSNLEEIFQDFLNSAQVDSSLCKATLTSFDNSPGGGIQLASAKRIVFTDAQHIGPLISALFKAQPVPANLRELEIQCKKGVDCGCDKNAPQFQGLEYDDDYFYFVEPMRFSYSCSQVRDLSSLSQWNSLRMLSLCGCTSVELWPDFATMTSLQTLNLDCTSFKECTGFATMTSLRYLFLSHTSIKECPGFGTMTSLEILSLSHTPLEECPDFVTMISLESLHLNHTALKEWPAGLLLLPSLKNLKMIGCTQVSTEEFTKVMTHIMPSACSCAAASAAYSLMCDVSDGSRDSCSIVDALHSHLPQLVALFYDLWHAPGDGTRYFHLQHVLAIEVMYDLWCEEAGYGSQSPYSIEEPGSRLLDSLMNEIPHCDGRSRLLDSPRKLMYGSSESCYRRSLLRSIGWYDVSVNDRTIKFLKSFVETPNSILLHSYNNLVNTIGEMTDSERQANISIQRVVKKLVVKAVCRMLRVPGVVAALREHQRASASNGHFMQWVTMIKGYINGR